MSKQSVSAALSEFVAGLAYRDIPHATLHVQKRALADALGVMLAATALEPACTAFLRVAELDAGPCTLLGSNATTSPMMAALSNGALAHALDFEDTHEGSLMHPNAAAIPAALAAAEMLGGVSGQELLTAMVAGSEVVCRLGLGLVSNPLEHGWYIPSILGAFGATAAVSRLLKLNANQTLKAFGFCLYQATCSAEFLRNGESVMRAVRDGFAARAGLLSALLGQQGLASVDEPFEGQAGLFAQYAPGGFNQRAMLDGLGTNFEAGQLSFKAWPSCRGTHPYVQAALALRTEWPQLDEIDSILVEVGEASVSRALVEPLPRKQAP